MPYGKTLSTKKSQFRLLDDPDSDNWDDQKMSGEKVAKYDDRLLFKVTGVVVMLKGDILSMSTEYDFNKTNSPDAKQITNFLDEKNFDIHAKGKSSLDKNLLQNYYNKRAILASGLKTNFLSENPNELCKGLKLIIQEKRIQKLIIEKWLL